MPMMFLTTADALLRGLIHKPIMGTVELSSYLLVTFCLSGLAYTELEREHIRVGFLLGRLGPRGRRVLGAFAALVGMGVSVLLVWQGWVLGVGERTVSDMLRIPQRPFRLFLPLCGALLGCVFFLELLEALKGEGGDGGS